MTLIYGCIAKLKEPGSDLCSCYCGMVESTLPPTCTTETLQLKGDKVAALLS